MTGPDRTVQLEALLARNGVDGLDNLIAGLGEGFNIDACLAAVGRYERAGQDAPGLLVHKIREAAKTPKVEDAPPPKQEVTPRLLRAIRGSCDSPNGFTRREARDMFAAAAKARGRMVDELIDLAVGEGWKLTMPHAAYDMRLARVERVAAYERWLSGGLVEAETHAERVEGGAHLLITPVVADLPGSGETT